MATVLALVAPIFGLILIGWAAALSGLLSERASEGLSDYVFAIAVPALIISTLTRPGLHGDIVWGYWFSYFGGAAIVWALASLNATRRRALCARAGTLHGFAASQSNTIFVGVPMILQAYGEEGGFPLFMLLAVHLPIMMGVATFLLESGGEQSVGERFRGLAGILGRNPIFIALAVGMLARSLALEPSGLVKTVLDGIGSTASTCALIALGAGLRRYRVLQDLRGASLIAALKLGLHPLAVWLLAFHVFTMPPAYAGVAVLFAAMPVGINSYLLAVRYKSETGLVAAAVMISTLAAAPTTALWLLVLGKG